METHSVHSGATQISQLLFNQNVSVTCHIVKVYLIQLRKGIFRK